MLAGRDLGDDGADSLAHGLHQLRVARVRQQQRHGGRFVEADLAEQLRRLAASLSVMTPPNELATTCAGAMSSASISAAKSAASSSVFPAESGRSLSEWPRRS